MDRTTYTIEEGLARLVLLQDRVDAMFGEGSAGKTDVSPHVFAGGDYSAGYVQIDERALIALLGYAHHVLGDLATDDTPNPKAEDMTDLEKIKAEAAEFPETFQLPLWRGGRRADGSIDRTTLTSRVSVKRSYVSEGRVVLYTEVLNEDGVWRSGTKGTAAELRMAVVRS